MEQYFNVYLNLGTGNVDNVAIEGQSPNPEQKAEHELRTHFPSLNPACNTQAKKLRLLHTWSCALKNKPEILHINKSTQTSDCRISCGEAA